MGKLQVQNIKNKQILAYLSCKLLLDYMATFFATLFSKALTSRFFQALWFLGIMEKYSNVNALGLIFPLIFLNFFMPVFFVCFPSRSVIVHINLIMNCSNSPQNVAELVSSGPQITGSSIRFRKILLLKFSDLKLFSEMRLSFTPSKETWVDRHKFWGSPCGVLF